MIQHPAITAALADHHRRTLIAEAETARLVSAARDGGSGSTVWPAHWLAPRRRPRIPAARTRLTRLRPARAY
jgi:hypothetical protein